MIVGVMQPYMFPYIGYWQLINAVETFVVYDDVNYIKGGYINRNSILLNGNSHWLTLNLLKASSNRLINEIEVSDNRGKILKTIEHAYKKSPFYNVVFPLVERCINNPEPNLARYICYSLIAISEYLKIDTRFVYSSDIEKDNTLKAQDKILEICNKLHATGYINAIGGQSLYDRDVFRNNDIDLKFVKAGDIQYKQFKNEFVPNLSIIDVLMFNDVDSVINMLDRYELV